MDLLFKEDNVQKYYFNNTRNKCSVGNDKIGKNKFENHLPSTTQLIEKKVLSKKYRFTSYKGVLINKGIDKIPRVIAVPTNRDKLVLGILKEYLAQTFPQISQPLVQTVIQNIKDEIDKYDSYIKIDIKNFYGSLNQQILLGKLDKIDKRAIVLIKQAIQNQIICHPYGSVEYKDKGVPQGLPISNILAEIYIKDIDDIHLNQNEYKYYRYVDDIFILCNKAQAQTLQNDIQNQLKNELKLDINEGKSYNRDVDIKTNYLGYIIKNKRFMVQDKSVKKLEKSIEKLFFEYKYNKEYSLDMLKWDLNLKITGCKFEENKYGWLFFYSQIDDISVLFHLDNLIQKLMLRYEVDTTIKIKRFVRAYNEIIKNLKNTSYIPHFSRYSIDEKRKILKTIFSKDTEGMMDENIEYEFNMRIYKKTRELEKDVQTVS